MEDKEMSRLTGPTIEVESAQGIREVSLDTRHLMNRRIFIHGEITDVSANEFLSQMLYLEQEADEPITIYINSPGGSVNAGLVIYDCIQSSNLEINIICAGMAASMAAIILAGGQKGHRYILPHSKVMIHEPLLSSGLGGSATSIKNISDSILETREIVNSILAKHTGKSLNEVNQATSFDNYMNADEAIAFGLCDAITMHIYKRI
jgi:ATP-dependent Clp protease protease subunit